MSGLGQDIEQIRKTIDDTVMRNIEIKQLIKLKRLSKSLKSI